MSSINSYKEVKLANGELVDRIKNLNQSDWIKICTKLGLYVSVGNGKGSHCAVYKDSICSPGDATSCVVTLPCHIFSNFQRDLIKKIIFYGIKNSKYTEEDVWIAIGVKKK